MLAHLVGKFPLAGLPLVSFQTLRVCRFDIQKSCLSTLCSNRADRVSEVSKTSFRSALSPVIFRLSDRRSFPHFRRLCTTPLMHKKAQVSVVFSKSGSEKVTVQGKEGDSLLDVVVDNNIDFDGFGACEGTLSCSTCHLIFKQADYDRLPEKPTDEELDMLDLAYGLTETSRLGCQVCLTKELDGIEVNVPAGVSDARDTSQASGN